MATWTRSLRFRSLLHYHCSHEFSTSPLSTCIIGSGPSGCYTAKYLLKRLPNIQVTILDELPTPFGLVRYGVAPDHADTKNVTVDFTENVLSDDRVSYFGGVKLTKNVSLSELQSMYDTIVLAYGASSDRKLGIEGEELNGIYSSRQFVNWYNGHPHFVNTITDSDFAFNKSKNIIVIGQGNVAIDCARIISQASNISKLSKTDITNHSIQMLSKFASEIKDISIIGRRGMVQSSFTNKELREVITDMSDECIATINNQEMIKSLNDNSNQEIESSRACKRKMAIFQRAEFQHNIIVSDKTCVHFRFLLSPIKFIADQQNGRVKSVVFEKNELIGDLNQQKAKGTGEFIEIEAGLVLTSIGYKSECINENIIQQNWNDKQNIINNKNGKINDGLYCVGWVKRGPSGIIGTNIPCAQQTVKSIINDYEEMKFENNNVNSNECVNKLKKLLNDKNVDYVDKNGWFNIDEYEKDIGKKNGKIREKMLDINQMIKMNSN